MADISENINNIIFANNLHMYYEAAKYRGRVSDFLDDTNTACTDYYIDRHIAQEVLTFLNDNAMMIGEIYSNIPFPEYVRVSTNSKEIYHIKPISYAEKVKEKRIIIVGKYDYQIYRYFQMAGYNIVSFGEMAQYSAYKNIVMEYINKYVLSVGGIPFYFKFPQANRIVNKSKLERFFADNSIYAYDPRACNYGLDETAIVKQPIIKTIERNGIVKLEDIEEEGITIRGGFRVTTNQPENYIKHCWMFGSSVVRGAFADNMHTMASQVQRRLNENCANTYKVINASNYSGNNIWNMVAFLESLPIKEGDICIFNLDFPNSLMEIDKRIVDLSGYFARPHEYGEVFIDMNHMTGKGYCIQGDIIFSYIKKQLIRKSVQNDTCHPANNSVLLDKKEDRELRLFINQIKKQAPRIGAIVMNCNPFTLGHRYLIECALKRVDRLFIFVVQEDTSEFSFEDRYEMVKLGTQDLKRITILPSGNYIISRKTFPAYSQKAELQEEIVDPSFDIELFGTKIAPALGINIRFAGQEPLDKVTKQYNEAMAETLPRYGIEFVEIPRKEIANEVISASRVRYLLKEHKVEALKEIVPTSTYLYIKEKLYDSYQQN